MQITGKATPKRYECPNCGAVEVFTTNHYGSIYNTKCRSCSWKTPMQPFRVWKCLEPLPEGWEVPPEWETTTLGDLCRSDKHGQ